MLDKLLDTLEYKPRLITLAGKAFMWSGFMLFITGLVIRLFDQAIQNPLLKYSSQNAPSVRNTLPDILNTIIPDSAIGLTCAAALAAYGAWVAHIGKGEEKKLKQWIES
ncbi:hypothetical protein [Chitinibacter sp. S2-10]|uniref:hypothetical protein n=1 Tax=Chitinibacter sp. S2-10 TaxID=3373597 RepID=UPI0039772892